MVNLKELPKVMIYQFGSGQPNEKIDILNKLEKITKKDKESRIKNFNPIYKFNQTQNLNRNKSAADIAIQESNDNYLKLYKDNIDNREGDTKSRNSKIGDCFSYSPKQNIKNYSNLLNFNKFASKTKIKLNIKRSDISSKDSESRGKLVNLI